MHLLLLSATYVSKYRYTDRAYKLPMGKSSFRITCRRQSHNWFIKSDVSLRKSCLLQ